MQKLGDEETQSFDASIEYQKSNDMIFQNIELYRNIPTAELSRIVIRDAIQKQDVRDKNVILLE